MTPIAAPTVEQSALMLAWAAIVVLALAMSGLLRQVHALTQAVRRRSSVQAGPATGSLVPRIPELNGARSALLLFADPGCASCESALARLAAGAQRGSPDVAYAVLYRGAVPHHNGHDRIATVPNADDIFTSLDVTVTPTAVAIDDGRVIASAPVGSPEFIDQFIDYVARETGTIT